MTCLCLHMSVTWEEIVVNILRHYCLKQHTVVKETQTLPGASCFTCRSGHFGMRHCIQVAPGTVTYETNVTPIRRGWFHEWSFQLRTKKTLGSEIHPFYCPSDVGCLAKLFSIFSIHPKKTKFVYLNMVIHGSQGVNIDVNGFHFFLQYPNNFSNNIRS